MSSPRVLLLGGHGKISMLLTPLMLSRSWHVTSVVRNPEHEQEILGLAEQGQKDRLEVLVRSLEDVRSPQDAKKVLDLVRPDYIVWSAGECMLALAVGGTGFIRSRMRSIVLGQGQGSGEPLRRWR